jgi:hypothetical protein
LLQDRGGGDEERVDIVVEGEGIGVTHRIRITDSARIAIHLVHRRIGINGDIVRPVQIRWHVQNIERKILGGRKNHVKRAS